MKNGMTARRLRIVLFIIMIAIVAAAASGFLYVKSGLEHYAATISQLNADAASGDSNIQTLRGLKSKLEQEQEVIKKTQSVVANSADFADKVIGNISNIAAQTGVTITGVEFTDSSGSAAPTTSAPPQATGTSTTPATASTPGVTKRTVSVSIKTPLEYSTLMQFLGALESNDLKMQPTSLTLSKDQGSQVGTQSLLIEVYVK